MKKLLAIFILACIFLSPALTSSASAHDYDYVYTDVQIVTPDSFEDIFSETEADRAAFTYEMATLNSSRAVVAMEIELKVGSDYYTTIVSGDIPAYTLPSGDTLYEGPISGTMTISEDDYRVTAGFTKLESTGGVLVSVTMQGDSTMVAFSFGENLIQGEVLDFFMEKAGSGQQNSTVGSNIIGNLDSDEFGNNSGVTASPMVIDPPGFFPIINPGPDLDLGENGEWDYQGIILGKITGTDYYAFETRIYYDITSGNLIVATKPRVSEVEAYAEYLGPITSVILDSFEAKVSILAASGPNCAAICAYSVPHRDIYGFSFLGYEATYLYAFITDVARYFSIPTPFKVKLEREIFGNIVVDYDMQETNIKVDLSILASTSANELEDLFPGLPILFRLERGTEGIYAGDTPYTVTSKIVYCVLITSTGGETAAVAPWYITETDDFSYTIDLVN